MPNLKGAVGGKKEKLGRWNCSDIVAIADNGIGGGNKRFVSGGRRRRKQRAAQKLARLSAKGQMASHESSTFVTRTKFRLRIVSVIILVR